VELWYPYFYVYGIGGLVFFSGLFIAWRKGALSKPGRMLPLLLGGFAFYLLLHGLLQAAGSVGAFPVAGDARGAEGTIGTTADIAVVFIYFAGIVGAGAYFAKFTKTSSDYFFGGRRFSGWLLAMSCVATTIGAYSFVKYASAGFSFGLSSSMSYLNDWFWMPLWMLVWLPIIYYGRIQSVPEYFERRFGHKARAAATFILLVYLIGYVGINFYTLGTALHALTGYSIFYSACGAAICTALYVTVGGQTSVIMTDLMQGFILLAVGLGLFLVGIDYVGGFGLFWEHLPGPHRAGLAPLTEPDGFHTMGRFWQDAMVGGVAFYFMNQGMLMRFMSARSVKEGRKAVALVILVVMPLAAIAVSGVGWIGQAMVSTGDIAADTSPDNVFVIVSSILAAPGIFGLVMATLTAALMSTADTLLTAVSAIVVNDIWRPYFAKPHHADAEDLRMARWATLVTAVIGIVLVPLFATFDSIYLAHATFVAAVVPPMAVTLVLGAVWSRYNQKAALLTLVGGVVAVIVSLFFPDVIAPFSQGVEPGGEGMKAYKYMRAFYGVVVCGTLAVIGVLVFREKEEKSPLLVAGPEEDAIRAFKAGDAEPKEGGAKIELKLQAVAEEARRVEGTDEIFVRMHPIDRDELGTEPGDLIHVAARGFWHGGLKSIQARVDDADSTHQGRVEFPEEMLGAAGIEDGDGVVVTLIG
jgi:SSS family solute:Na+ symporter